MTCRFALRARTSAAFTFVELAIVITIIALVAGGVLAGQELIRASELQSIATEYRNYTAAVQAFKGKYMGLPGDLKNATEYWGTAGGNGTGIDTGCTSAIGTGTATCNGNGTGRLDDIYLTTSGGPLEQFRFWQHLVNAGLVSGTYNGVVGNALRPQNTPTNSPAGKYGSNTLWLTHSNGWFSSYEYMQFGNTGFVNPDDGGRGAVSEFKVEYGNYLMLGKQGGNGDFASIYSYLTPLEMASLDNKIDDGKPGSGKMVASSRISSRAMGLGLCTTTSSATDYTADYLTTSSQKACAVIFPRVF